MTPFFSLLSMLAACSPKSGTGGAGPLPSAQPTATSEYATNDPVYSVRDSGTRCIVAPCPSWAATDVKTKAEREVTGVDISALNLPAEEADHTRTQILFGKTWARGAIKRVPQQGPGGDGTVLVVTQLVTPD